MMVKLFLGHVPNNCVIREIEKNRVYTYIQRYEDGALDRGGVGVKSLEIDGKEIDIEVETVPDVSENYLRKQG